jgi:NhaP-type Na+/H+ and K+/H+ antiporter
VIFEGFTFEGDVLLGTIAAFYGFDVSSADKITSLAEWLRGHARREPVVGDCIRFQRIELTVQHMVGKRITKIGFGLRLEASVQQRPIWPLVVPSMATERAGQLAALAERHSLGLP